MKIKTRLALSSLFLVAIVLTFGFTLTYLSQQVTLAYEQDDAVDEIENSVYELNILIGDYLLHPGERASTQWFTKHDYLTNYLEGLDFKSLEERYILERIRQNHEVSREIFSQLAASDEDQEPTGDESGLQGIYRAQIAVKLQDMISDTHQLSLEMQNRFSRAREAINLYLLIFVVVMAAGLGINSYFLLTNIANPITQLHEGVEMIRRGNLDYEVGIYSEDEIGNLSQAFDQMTEELRARTEELNEYSGNLEDLVKQRTEELREAQEKLVHREKLAILGQMAGGMAHELRNPLGAIKNATYFLNMTMEESDPEVKETLEILEKEIDASEKIIRSLLDYAHARPPNRWSVDVNELVNEAQSNIVIPENIEIIHQLDETIPSILADPGQLVQIIENIVLNALQAMPDGGELTVRSEASTPEMVAIHFCDTGDGIPEENLERIWEPLFTTKARGIGLGLPISKTLVEGNGGTIEVESTVGVGTRFTVFLPLGLDTSEPMDSTIENRVNDPQ